MTIVNSPFGLGDTYHYRPPNPKLRIWLSVLPRRQSCPQRTNIGGGKTGHKQCNQIAAQQKMPATRNVFDDYY